MAMGSVSECVDATNTIVSANPDNRICASVLGQDWQFYQTVEHSGILTIVYFNQLPKLVADKEGTIGVFASGEAVGRSCVGRDCSPWVYSSPQNPLSIVQKYPSIQRRDGWQLDSCFPGLSSQLPTQTLKGAIAFFWQQNSIGLVILFLTIFAGYALGVYYGIGLKDKK